MTRRHGRFSHGQLLAAVTVAVLALAVLPGSAAAQATPVDTCRSISEPGEYRLAGNISGNESTPCLRITASDVALDGQGNAVVGNDAGAIGVLVEPTGNDTLTNVTVSNLTTTGWQIGLAYRGGVATGTVRNVTAAANRDGLVIDPELRFQATGGTVELIDNRAIDNERWGIALRPGADADRVTGTTLRNNDVGFVAADVRNLSLADTRAVNNTWGLVIGDVTASTLRNTTILNNARDGLRAGNGFDGSRLLDTTVRANGGDGLRIGPANNVTLRNATATDNAGSGLVLRDAADVRATALAVTGNEGWGLDFDGVADALLVDVTAGRNAAGFYTATDSGNVTIRSI